MSDFPRTQIEDVSLPRLLIGTNWFLGYSHTSKAKDKFIEEQVTAEKTANILEVFLEAGIDAILGPCPWFHEKLWTAMQQAQDRTGRKLIVISTPILRMDGSQDSEDANRKVLDGDMEAGTAICMPHQATTDALLDRTALTIRRMDEFTAMIRQREMIPGLASHMPETPVYADFTNLDVATYIQIYNAAGFMMQVEIDWVHRIIHEAKKPVITIKPLAAGRLLPLVGLAFSWATIRDQDMVAIGCSTPDEAREVIDISLAQLAGRSSTVELQRTRSKTSIDGATARKTAAAGS
jgi:hypothetical protein